MDCLISQEKSTGAHVFFSEKDKRKAKESLIVYSSAPPIARVS